MRAYFNLLADLELHNDPLCAVEPHKSLLELLNDSYKPDGWIETLVFRMDVRFIYRAEFGQPNCINVKIEAQEARVKFVEQEQCPVVSKSKRNCRT